MKYEKRIYTQAGEDPDSEPARFVGTFSIDDDDVVRFIVGENEHLLAFQAPIEMHVLTLMLGPYSSPHSMCEKVDYEAVDNYRYMRIEHCRMPSL